MHVRGGGRKKKCVVECRGSSFNDWRVTCCKRRHSPGAQPATCWVFCQTRAGRGKQNTRGSACSCRTGWQSNTGSGSAGRSRLGSLAPGLHLGGFPGRKTRGMNFQRTSPPRCVPARRSSLRPAAAAATASRGGFQVKSSCSPGGRMRRDIQLGER